MTPDPLLSLVRFDNTSLTKKSYPRGGQTFELEGHIDHSRVGPTPNALDLGWPVEGCKGLILGSLVTARVATPAT